jgi:hypothetical protein
LFCLFGGIVDHHCWEVIVCFVDIGGIVDHHCLDVIVCFVDIGRIVDHHCLDSLFTVSFSSLLSICLMVFKATFNNISVISWRSVLLMEETGVPGENHRPSASH